MVIYFVVFAIVMLITVFAQTLYKKNPKISKFLSLIAILILSLFAAIRGLTVGTDINIYGYRYFHSAGYYPNIISYLNFYETEHLYFVLNYIVYSLTHNIHVLFFVFQFFIALVVYNIAYKEKENGTMWLYILSYLMLWFNSSLNILRQSLAIFVILYAFRYIEDKKYFKYIIAVLVASLFHKSALLCLIFPLLSLLSNSKRQKLYLILIVIVTLIVYNYLDYIIIFTQNNMSFFQKYVSYLSNEEGNINWYFAAVKLIMLSGIIVFSKKAENKRSNNLLIMLAVIDLLLYCFSAYIKYGYRLSYFFLPHLIILIPRIDKSLENYSGRSLYRLFIIVSLIVYWIVRYCLVQYDGTIPYVFFWQ